MHIARKRQRITVDIAVTITTVLESLDARIVDLSEHGAQIAGATLTPGAKFQIGYMGQTVYAQCMWSEIDRMGARFPFNLSDGPLHDALMAAISGNDEADFPTRPSSLVENDYSANMPRRTPTAIFGRRSHH